MEIWDRLRRIVRVSLALRSGTDAKGTIDDIAKRTALRGSNAWMLVCSALLASIGLDVNSTAVIIGAMLISPLMSPILGVGLAIAIEDRALLGRSLRNLAQATLLSLLTSVAYFTVSPLGELTAEMNSRTTPTILDVGVAFFGGIAGIVAGSRRDKTNAIPGVAIATALMPPLCTAGFGLAKLNFSVFLGASYLFFINAVFIALATYLICVWLKFPKAAEVDERTKRIVRRVIAGFAVLVVIPSALIFWEVIRKLRFDRDVRRYVTTELRRDERQPVRWEIAEADGERRLKVYSVGTAPTSAELEKLRIALADYRLSELRLEVIPLNVSPDEFRRLATDVETNLATKVGLLERIDDERRRELVALRAEIADIRKYVSPEGFVSDMRSLFPEIERAEWAVAATDGAPDSSKRVLVIAFVPKTTEPERRAVAARISKLVESRFPGSEIRSEPKAEEKEK